ncbi:F-box/kelch-repeat protein At3g06240-like [Rutidosis leptorrhynchoides]|uniref:F-box/kelch-repeat protein At3g06240-like n=1 Tax=Rutidosis leptorrhynchoides TaxID=125765 RepID=UPI003A997311
MDVMIEEILARLDVKDALRCKSVCKSWYNLISSDYFVNAHLKRSYNYNREHGYIRIRLHCKNNNVTKFRDCMMVGSCDGLVCISPGKGELLLTNPSTREVSRKLPKLPMLPYNDRRKVCWGFGYDSLKDDYKVVAGFNISEHHMCFQVLSLKSNKWKFIGDGDYLTYNTNTYYSNSRGVSYHGALHWFMNDTEKKKTIILSFDLSLEKFKEIQLRKDTEYVYDEIDRRGIFEERLCIFRNYYFLESYYYPIWVMKNCNCWQLRDYEGNKHDVAPRAYKLHCSLDNNWRLCDDDKGNVDLSWLSLYNITYPIFVNSLASPYPCGKPKKNTNNKSEESPKSGF